MLPQDNIGDKLTLLQQSFSQSINDQRVQVNSELQQGLTNLEFQLWAYQRKNLEELTQAIHELRQYTAECVNSSADNINQRISKLETNANRLNSETTILKQQNIISSSIPPPVTVETKKFDSEIFSDSTLLKEQQMRDYVKSIIPQFKQAKLLYRGSRDGWKPADFHRLCDGKGPTVCLAKTSLGKICGGYTSLSWSSSGNYKYDQASLLFSIDKQVKYPVLRKESAVYHKQIYGWCFGNDFLSMLHTPMNKENGGYCYKFGDGRGDDYQVGKDSNGNNMLTGEKFTNFTCVETEVYQILI